MCCMCRRKALINRGLLCAVYMFGRLSSKKIAARVCHIVSVFNNQVLCESCIVANSKRDRWVGLADKQSADPTSLLFALRDVLVGS